LFFIDSVNRHSSNGWNSQLSLLPVMPPLSSVMFESDSRLACTSLASIVIPRNVEILCCDCSNSRHALLSVTLEPYSQSARIEFDGFVASWAKSIVYSAKCGISLSLVFCALTISFVCFVRPFLTKRWSLFVRVLNPSRS
jgi:hypothetical protein